MIRVAIVGLLMLIAGGVKAETEMADVANSSSTALVSVSSSALAGDITDMGSTTCPSGRKSIEIHNLDGTANLFCGVAKVAITRTAGRKIAPSGSWVLGIRCKDYNAVTMSIWCVSDAAAATLAWVTQLGNR